MSRIAPPNPGPNPGSPAAFLEHVRTGIRRKHFRPRRKRRLALSSNILPPSLLPAKAGICPLKHGVSTP